MKKQVSTEPAFRHYLEQFSDNARGLGGDRRKRGCKAVFSYFTRDGIEFRRAFWLPARSPVSEAWKISPEYIEVPADF